jgi:hypothetical protein
MIADALTLNIATTSPPEVSETERSLKSSKESP